MHMILLSVQISFFNVFPGSAFSHGLLCRFRPKREWAFWKTESLNARFFSVRSQFCVFKKTFPVAVKGFD